jgi:hypothetical protein
VRRKEGTQMKRLLLLTCVFVTVVLAGVLHGNYKPQENREGLSLTEAYMAHYPEIMPAIAPTTMIDVPF